MNKVVLRGISIVASFFAAWFVLSQADWLSILRVEQVSNKTEEKLGDLFWEVFKKDAAENQDPFVTSAVDSMLAKVCVANRIDKDKIKLHILMKDEVNAFALPDGHLVLYSGLITAVDEEGELSGVICHEIAHIELRHVMKKLIKEVGLTMLISMATGGNGTEVMRESAKLLSSTAFDRALEKEADIQAVEYLAQAHISPRPFANFLNRLADVESAPSRYLSWISTHPAAEERAAYILAHTEDKAINDEPILTSETWRKLKDLLME
ncbi:M48 family metallopeptidase [Parapedobacter sp. DT-150]|uniref:M48 family metallopeptidase n=1 Tax=Parapedobacter sp. DT-150 TaxID=3396162 RepID=UPI003F1DAC51